MANWWVQNLQIGEILAAQLVAVSSPALSPSMAMASFASLAPTPLRRLSPTLLTRSKGSLRPRSWLIPPAAANCESAEGIRSDTERFVTKRREALVQIFLASVSIPFAAMDASAETDLQESLRTYEDETNKFRILIPKDWLVGAGDADGIKSITAFYPEGSSDSNVSVVITGLGPDFTRLESFGNVDAFAETLVSGLDRSWKRPPGVTAKLINSKSSNGLYYIEYTLQFPGERCRHILTALGIASNGWYNRLYTVTGQYMEDEADKYQPQILKTVSSFKLI
ncbi:psbP domain-containing protein 3, chloroplastic isoform X1 [Canna indica]|uniref:PsbP domain-containing protein 3, chloroplastic isoform X1 n=1 Tax=Canna indica TaxID=4628 RepID=A0AAQ3QIJ9_9LILI|nr:psbP domain-containing protein 3, chloroplastic isoform X1 [Canna indica]